MNLSILSGPVIGAIIGYGTNWIAIKMLFRPVKPIRIGKVTLPFTPGIIPKRKEKLAKAIGEMVGNNLFTRNDIEKMLLSEEMETEIINAILGEFSNEETIKNKLLDHMEEREYLRVRETLKIFISEKIRDGLLKIQIGELIANEGGQVIRDKFKGGLLRMLVTDDLIDSLLKPMGSEIEKYLKEHGQEKIMPVVESEIDTLENVSIKDLTNYLKFDSEKLEDKLKNIYRDFVMKYVSSFLEKLNIVKVVEKKINEMEVLELEKLLLSIMKKELGAIVNLGALIGFMLGTLNIFL